MVSGTSLARRTSILLAGIAIFGLTVSSQTFYGSITGTITGPSGTAVEGAAVAVTNTGTGERRSAATGPEGTYLFVNLVPGNYKVEVERAGFERYTRNQIAVHVEAAVRVDVAIRAGDMARTFEAQPEVPLLETENASLSQVVSARSVEELPLNGRNVLDLVGLSPGVVPQGSSDGNLTGKNVLSAGNFQIGGGTANQSASYYDGVPSNTTYGNTVALVPTQDAVAEFRVQTNNLGAEYGRYTGGVVNITSKSGTNEFHGSAYEFLRNRSLNAGTFFANATGAGKPAFTQNQYGVTLGGPVKKNKVFFFAGYEGFRQRQAALYLLTVPTAPMLTGDFSDLRDAAGARIPIYDPLTNCGQLGNPACGSGAVQRAPFPNNLIPSSRTDPVAARFAAFPVWGLPNIPGQPYTHNFNFSKNATAGGDNDQYNARADRYVSDKQRVLTRYTRWDSRNVPVPVYGTALVAGDPHSPDSFVTDQAIVADTYTLNPHTILDIRIGFMRWGFGRVPGTLGIDIPKTFGLPGTFSQLEGLDGVSPVATVPQIAAAGYTWVGTGKIDARDNTYVITPSLVEVMGKHTWKLGGELRRLDINYFQNNTTGGAFAFDNLFTSRNALDPGATGNSIASFLLGYPSGGTVQTSPFTAGSMRYQGYYANDTIQAGTRLTLSLGLRWEIPGVYTERFDRLATFDPGLINPATASVAVNGRPVTGGYVLVNSADHPERGLRPEHWTLFAPRAGAAYRLTARTVVRMGAGLFYVPADIQFPEGPYGNAVNYINNVMVSSINSQVTPSNTLSDPFPSGFLAPTGRDPSFQKLLLGGSARGTLRHVRYAYAGQWNLTLQHLFPREIAVEAAYAGLRGIHLPQGSLQYNSLPDAYMPLGAQLQQQVANPFFGLVANGPLARQTVQLGQLLLPFPEYLAVPDPGGYIGNSVYHALQAKAEKHLGAGGTLLASYTFSKIISDVETLTIGLEAGTGVAAIQDFNNFRGERSLSSFDTRQRLSLSYVVDFPIGNGKKLLPGVKGIAGKVISGWGMNGVVTFQEGLPMGLTASPNLTGFNTGLRPNVAAGCDKVLGGPAQSRLNRWFNTACFTVPAAFSFGSESRTDPTLRGHGTNNWNVSLFKRTPLTERFSLELRAEAFNVFNRVQFGTPNLTASTAANNTFGAVSSQLNQPRLIQLALRLRY